MTTQPTSDTFVRACLLNSLYDLSRDKEALDDFTGNVYLTYPQGKRLRTQSISGVFQQGFIQGRTFPELLGILAKILSTPHGQVLCNSMLDPGITGIMSIGYAVFWEHQSRHLLAPRPSLIGVIVQLDGREMIYSVEPGDGVAHDASGDENLSTLVTNTWLIAETIDNMTRAPLPPNAPELAQDVLDFQPTISMPSGKVHRLSGSDVPGTISHEIARRFLERASRDAAAETEPEKITTTDGRLPGRLTRHPDAKDVVDAFTAREVDASRAATRTYRPVN